MIHRKIIYTLYALEFQLVIHKKDEEAYPCQAFPSSTSTLSCEDVSWTVSLVNNVKIRCESTKASYKKIELERFFLERPINLYLWVLGPRKFQLIMMTVTRILTVFMMKVKSRYLAISGSTREVGGRIFDTSKRNTTSDSKILIPKVTWNNILFNIYDLIHIIFNCIPFRQLRQADKTPTRRGTRWEQ